MLRGKAAAMLKRGLWPAWLTWLDLLAERARGRALLRNLAPQQPVLSGANPP